MDELTVERQHPPDGVDGAGRGRLPAGAKVEIADAYLQISHRSEDSVASGAEHSRPTISTHVLDAERGAPAAGVHVVLYKLGEDDRPIRLTQALTDSDGRVRDLLDRPMSRGDYRLEFLLSTEREHVSPATFFRRLSVDLRIDDVARSYHVPLLLSSYAMTTYRGS
jgi:5-hydroxyisourate hydrolase